MPITQWGLAYVSGPMAALCLQDPVFVETLQDTNLSHAILMAVGAIAALLIISTLIGMAARLAKHKASALAMSKLPKISIGRIPVFNPKRVTVWLGALIRVAHYTAVAIAAYLCIAFVLSCFPYTHPWAELLEAGLVALLLNIGENILHGLPGLASVVLIVLVARGLTRLINTVFKSVERGLTTLPWIYQDTAAPTRRIAVALLWVLAIVLAYPHIPGNESIAFKSISVFIGLLVSFGSAGVVNQAMNGLAIMYARSFKCGDFVRIGENEGTVSEVTLLSTKLITIQLEEIIIPNSVVITQTTRNYTRAAGEYGVGIATSVSFGYDTPWRQVHALLMTAVKNTKGLCSDPAPYIVQDALSDTWVEYRLVVHMTGEPKLRQFVMSELHQNIQDAFNTFGVQLTTPKRIMMEVPAPVPEARWYPPPAEKIDLGTGE